MHGFLSHTDYLGSMQFHDPIEIEAGFLFKIFVAGAAQESWQMVTNVFRIQVDPKSKSEILLFSRKKSSKIQTEKNLGSQRG